MTNEQRKILNSIPTEISKEVKNAFIDQDRFAFAKEWLKENYPHLYYELLDRLDRRKKIE